ncbi:uncharacterized protein LOC119452651 [Dermacentor silvarum]|uniref:uncharacterized protein LOC119452651 n=1 Tax=Dermacentor silvarum TaxID=543639 RepID=UPI00210073EE|nr:uncharacterized protein LOC119452651 [Dermacentor silvarum]
MKFGGGDAAPAVGVVKPSAGRGRGRVKLNVPAPVAASSLTAPPQQQMPVAMVPEPRNRGPHWNALSQLDAGDYRRQHGETHRDSQVKKFKKEACEEVNTSRYSSRVGISPHFSKPGRQMYRPPAMNCFGGGDAAPAVGVVQPSAGRGRGRVKLNVPAPVAASSLTAPPQQQRPVAMVPVPRGSHCKALLQLDAGDYRRQHGETHRDSQMQKFKKEACEEVNTSRYSSRVGISPHSSKPGRQMYRPPAPMTSGSRDQPMRSGQAETANGGGGVSNSVPWNAALGKESLTDMTGCSKCPPLSSGMPAEPPFGQQGQKAVKEIKGAEQPNSSSRKEETDPASPPSDKRSIIAIALTDPDGLNALQMQWLGFSTCNEVTIGSNDAASAVEFCLSVIKSRHLIAEEGYSLERLKEKATEGRHVTNRLKTGPAESEALWRGRRWGSSGHVGIAKPSRWNVGVVGVLAQVTHVTSHHSTLE